MRFSSFQPWTQIDLIETDYQQYAIMYSCTNYFGIYTKDFFWVLLRQSLEKGSFMWTFYDS